MAASVSACGSSEAASGNGVEKHDLTVGVLPVLAMAQYYIAKQRGFFKAEGLNVHETQIQGAGPAMGSLLSGKLDVMNGAYESLILAASKGVKLRVIASNGSGTPNTSLVMTTPDSSIHSPQQLRGKTIATNALEGKVTMLTKIQLEIYGVPPNSVKFVPVPLPQTIQSLQKHAVDAASMPEPFVTQAQQQIGAVKVLDLTDGPSKNFPGAGWTTTAQFAQQNPKTVAAFHRAIAKASPLANDRRVVEQIAPTFLPKMSKQELSVVGLGHAEGSIDVTSLQRVADDMKRVGMLKKPFNVAPLLGK